MSAEVELRMLEGSEFQTVGAAMLNLREAKVVRTRGTDKRLVLAERRERVGIDFLRYSTAAHTPKTELRRNGWRQTDSLQTGTAIGCRASREP